MSWNEVWLITCGVIVLIGVFLEGSEHLHDWKTKGLRPVVPKLGFSILLIGLVGETYFESRVGKESAIISLEAAKLRQAVAWRHLTSAQVKILRSSLSRYDGERLAIYTYMDDLEAWAFADHLVAAIGPHSRANWNVYTGRITFSPRLTSGLIIEVSTSGTKRDWAAAEALAEALRSFLPYVIGPALRNPAFNADRIFGDANAKSATIVVTLGVHPPPPSDLEDAQ